MGAETPPFKIMDEFTKEELAYIKLAVERMAPLAHRSEAALQGQILEKLRAIELNIFRRSMQDRNLR